MTKITLLINDDPVNIALYFKCYFAVGTLLMLVQVISFAIKFRSLRVKDIGSAITAFVFFWPIAVMSEWGNVEIWHKKRTGEKDGF